MEKQHPPTAAVLQPVRSSPLIFSTSYIWLHHFNPRKTKRSPLSLSRCGSLDPWCPRQWPPVDNTGGQRWWSPRPLWCFWWSRCGTERYRKSETCKSREISWASCSTALKHKALYPRTSWEPWEKLRRAMFIPAFTISWSLGMDRDAGPENQERAVELSTRLKHTKRCEQYTFLQRILGLSLTLRAALCWCLSCCCQVESFPSPWAFIKWGARFSSFIIFRVTSCTKSFRCTRAAQLQYTECALMSWC